MEKELENNQLHSQENSGDISLSLNGIIYVYIHVVQCLSNCSTYSTVSEATKHSLDQKLLKLQKLQDDSHYLTLLLKEMN